MWKKIILFLAVKFCTEICAKSIYYDHQNERPEQVPVNQHVYYTQQYGPALQDLALYVQKLQEQGLVQPIVHNSAPFILSNNGNEYGYQYGYPSYQVAHPNIQQQQNEAQPTVVEDKDIPSTDAGPSKFDELEIIQLIPIIINQLKSNDLTFNEKQLLENIFGDSLWSMIIAEASRSNHDEMNPLLKTILNSEEVRLAKRDITTHFGNDIYKNSLRRVYRGGSTYPALKSQKPYISLDDDRKMLSPSERLLNMIAAIVHKSNVMEKSRQKAEREAKLKQKEKLLRKKSKKSMGGNPLGIIKPRQRYVDRILNINRMKRSIIKFGTDLDDMRALLDHVNRDNDLLFEADSSDDDYEYMDDDYELDDAPKQQQQNQLTFDDDYSVDFHPQHHRNIFDDYENGSVNEFVNLARQRDRREKNFDSDEMQNDQEEYDDDDDYELYDDN